LATLVAFLIICWTKQLKRAARASILTSGTRYAMLDIALSADFQMLLEGLSNLSRGPRFILVKSATPSSQRIELPEISGRFRPIISYRSCPAYHLRHDAKTVQPLPKTGFGSKGGFTRLGTVIICD
jgi:hypothetical protein